MWKSISLAICIISQCHTLKDGALTYYQNNSQENGECPTWFVFNRTSSKCECGDNLNGLVSCNDQEGQESIAVLDCYCMTPSKSHDIVVGQCFYNCEDSRHVFSKDYIYRRMPLNTSLLNSVMCEKRFNRAGRLCGQCKDGYFPSAFSFDLTCRKCPPNVNTGNWIKFFVISFVPLTIFFLIVLVFRINASSPPLLAYIFVAQCLSSPINSRLTLLALQNYPTYLNLAKTVLGLYGIWNLDFFRTFYPPLCLKITTLQVLALNYVVSLYPLVLVIVTYVIIQLHARGCFLLVLLWAPFKKFYGKYQSEVNSNSSIIHVFASFLVFSSNQFLCTTIDLLSPTPLYDVNGTNLGLYLYYDASYKYFGPRHLPYGILALLAGLVFVVLPVLLLLLYPIRKTQLLWGNWTILRFFVESFQGYFKDGTTEGEYDLRYFSATFLMARIAFFMLYATTPNSVFFPLLITIAAVILLLLATLRPYKKKYSIYNKVEIVHMVFFLVWFSLATSRLLAAIKNPKLVPALQGFVAITGSLPLLYLPLLACYHLKSYEPLQKTVTRMKTLARKLKYTARDRKTSVRSRKSLDEISWLLEQQAQRDHEESKQIEETPEDIEKMNLDHDYIA